MFCAQNLPKSLGLGRRFMRMLSAAGRPSTRVEAVLSQNVLNPPVRTPEPAVRGLRRCVMCGAGAGHGGVTIPRQNKDVCRFAAFKVHILRSDADVSTRSGGVPPRRASRDEYCLDVENLAQKPGRDCDKCVWRHEPTGALPVRISSFEAAPLRSALMTTLPRRASRSGREHTPRHNNEPI